MADEKKALDGLKKELESLQKKVKIIDAQLKTAEDDLEAFQVGCEQSCGKSSVVIWAYGKELVDVVSCILFLVLLETDCCIPFM